ncbi:MAG: 16S rRNA (uracil(1498)-N(3))-methyltransferase [Gammaproteobacteria bacterium]|nr:16S rRNA (uracil(1498)-N(3))-methyltransferase [Gammaproteobacteria bacterium]
MRLPRVHIDADLVPRSEVWLDKARGHYLKNVLRLKPGAAFFLFNGRAAEEFEAHLVIDGKRVGAKLGAARTRVTESSLDCEILQGLARSDHVDWTIQKTTELGVSRIRLFNADRTQSPLKPAQLERKLAHWRGVAISACEQCGRVRLPRIEFHANLAAALTAAPGPGFVLDFTGEPLARIARVDSNRIKLLLGPEGGLTAEEIEAATAGGFLRASLGPRVLRTETAATAALAITQVAIGDLR